jgi:hypothetical protein
MIFGDDEDGEGERKKALQWLCEEIEKAVTEKARKRDKWDKWRRQREGLPEHEQKEYPFPKAANVAVPLAVSNMNTIYGSGINMFSGLDPFWTVSAVRDGDSHDMDIADAMTRYYTLLAKSPTDLNKDKVDPVIIYEGTNMGTCFVKVPYTKRDYKSMATGPDGKAMDVTVTIHDGPELVPIPIEDFLYREAYQDLRWAPWVAHQQHHTWPELQQLQENGYYQDVDELESWARHLPELNEGKEQMRFAVSQQEADIWDVQECYFFWNVEGTYRDCIMTIHRDSRTILREEYNSIGVRPFEPFCYVIRPFKLEGMGVGHLSEHMQDEVDSMHNYRIDSLHTSLSPMIAIRKTSSIKTNEKVYPGKIWFLDDPQKDISPIKFPDISPVSLQAEGMAIQYSQKAVGANDAMGGFPDSVVKTRDSPGLQNQRLQRGTGIFSAVMSGMEASYSRVAELIFYQLVNNKDLVLEKETRIKRMSDTDLALLTEALSIPPGEIPSRLRFSIRTTDVEQTFDAKRQNVITLTQLYTQFFQTMMPIVQALFSPQANQMKMAAPDLYAYLVRMYVGKCKLMEDTFKFFNEQDTAKYVPDWKRFAMMQELQTAMQGNMNMLGGAVGGQPGGGGPAGGPPGPGVQPGIPGGVGGGGGAGQGMAGVSGGGTSMPQIPWIPAPSSGLG